jgi:hypothetical protein
VTDFKLPKSLERRRLTKGPVEGPKHGQKTTKDHIQKLPTASRVQYQSSFACSSMLHRNTTDAVDPVQWHAHTDRCPYVHLIHLSERAVGAPAIKRSTWVWLAGRYVAPTPPSSYAQCRANQGPAWPTRRVLEYQDDEARGIQRCVGAGR